MSDTFIFNISTSALKLGPVLAHGASGTTLYKADLQQGQRSFQVLTVFQVSDLFPDLKLHVRPAVACRWQ